MPARSDPFTTTILSSNYTNQTLRRPPATAVPSRELRCPVLQVTVRSDDVTDFELWHAGRDVYDSSPGRPDGPGPSARRQPETRHQHLVAQKLEQVPDRAHGRAACAKCAQRMQDQLPARPISRTSSWDGPP